MKGIYLSLLLLAGFFAVSVVAQQYIADYSVAKEEVLRSIPAEYFNKARDELVIAYQHTSHGTHVSYGVFGLQDYKEGDTQLFGVSKTYVDGKLHFMDYALKPYAPDGINASDLSIDETAFIQTTRNFLDAFENASVNVVMWSWCNIAGHDVSVNYLPGMTTLISEYGVEGTKIGSGEGQRERAVSFIFMTGHANVNANTGDGNPKNQASLITDHCNANGQFCLDYYSIDSHDMVDNFWEDVGDNGNSAAYGGNFYEDWQHSHTVGTDYYENRYSPRGSVTFGEHNSQHITANRKAYAFWWILARIAGWSGTSAPVMVSEIRVSPEGDVTSMQTGETLQFSAGILPENASNKTIQWSITDQTGSATITQAGLLSATSAGTVLVVATAQDGSGVSDTIDLIIEDSILISSVFRSDKGAQPELILYPNPGNGCVYLDRGSFTIELIEVVDQGGKTVKQFKPGDAPGPVLLEMTGFSTGCYFVRVHSEGRVIHRKLIIY